MSFQDAISEQLANGFGSDISSAEIMLTLGVAFLIGCYLFFVYRLITENAFYSKNFNISMVAMAVVTAAIIMSMQSSLVISLGMVGALSIVRFRTAIKEPLDLLFLFWSIGTGIICGAGLYKIAIILAACVTVIIFILRLIPEMPGDKMLFVACDSNVPDVLEQVEAIVNSNTKYFRVKSKNIGKQTIDIIVDVRVKDENALIAALRNCSGVNTLSLVSHEGEFRG